jgi:hypothetical protein
MDGQQRAERADLILWHFLLCGGSKSVYNTSLPNSRAADTPSWPRRRFHFQAPMTDADFAAELREFARQLKALRFRGVEAYLADLDGFAAAMSRRAAELAPVAPPTRTRAPEHARLRVGQVRIKGPTGVVAMVAVKRRRTAAFGR